MSKWDGFEGGRWANERTQHAIDVWKGRESARKAKNMWALIALIGALACFAYAFSVNPY